MIATDHEDLDRIIGELEPDHIPTEFVAGARVTDYDGDTYTISPGELEEIMTDEKTLIDQDIAVIRLILDVEQIKAAIIKNSEFLLSSVTF